MNDSVGKHAIKQFFTESEWDLIYNLVANEVQFCADEEEDLVTDYYSVTRKIVELFNNN